MPNKASCGFDNISTLFIKQIPPTIITPVTVLINQVFNTGILPERLKLAKVIPVFKKGDSKLINNYRPISLLPVLYKVLEKSIANQLSKYFEDNKLFHDNQYGFRTGLSTEYATIELTDIIISNMDRNEIPFSIFLAQNKLAAAQTKMERSMLNITYKDRKTNIWVRERTKVIDIINTVRKMKWSWAGHINRLKDDRWTSRVTSWRPYDKKRRQGRPAKRWRDDLDKYWSDTIWQRKAQDRVVWRRHAEAFAQPRDTTAA